MSYTYCDTLQHTATHCNTPQHTATYCDTLQQTATHCNTPSFVLPQSIVSYCKRSPIARGLCEEFYCNRIARGLCPIDTRGLCARCVLLRCPIAATHCNTLQHTATYCDTLQRAFFWASSVDCVLLQEDCVLLTQEDCVRGASS